MSEPGIKGQTVFRDASLVILGYIAIRAVIYHFQPNTSLDAWSRRDAWMTIPRLSAFLALLALNRWRWKCVPFDFRLKIRAIWAVAFGTVFIAISAFDYSASYGPHWPASNILLGILVTPFVGFFEEYAFRGAILSSLLPKLGKGRAIFLSSALFAIYHVQAQSFRDWGWLYLFLMGVLFANLRVMGFSLWWLAIAHGIIDSIYFFFRMFGHHAPMALAAFGLFAIATLAMAFGADDLDSSRKPLVESL